VESHEDAIKLDMIIGLNDHLGRGTKLILPKRHLRTHWSILRLRAGRERRHCGMCPNWHTASRSDEPMTATLT